MPKCWCSIWRRKFISQLQLIGITMFNQLQNPLSLLGRLLLAALFLTAGIGKITSFSGTVGYISSVGLPLPEVGAALALTVEILGSIALIIGLGIRPAALVLALFTVVASLFFHNYWGVPADQQRMQQLLFYKNLAVVGGLLTVAAWGAGAWSLDARRNAGKSPANHSGLRPQQHSLVLR
jgi:putative oxidoreductase